MFVLSFALRWLEGTFHYIKVLVVLFKMDCKYTAFFNPNKFSLKKAKSRFQLQFNDKIRNFSPNFADLWQNNNEEAEAQPILI